MPSFLSRRNAAYTAVGLGVTIAGLGFAIDPSMTQWPARILLGIGLIILIGSSAYSFVHRNDPVTDPKPGINIGSVSSVNQSGGITAGVYVGNPPRTLGDNFKAELLRKLPRGKPVEISKCVGIADAQALVDEISAFLRANGFTLLPVGDVLGMQLKGVAIWEHTDPPQIIVGDR